MIRLTDPTRLGPALGEVRGLLGMSRRGCARRLGAATGRTTNSVNAQLWTWDAGVNRPDLASLAPYLKVLGVTLMLDFVEEPDGPVSQ